MTETVEIECEIVEDSNQKAVAIIDGTEEAWQGIKRPKWFWVPRSLIVDPDHDSLSVGDKVTLEIPVWFAEKEGLV